MQLLTIERIAAQEPADFTQMIDTFFRPGHERLRLGEGAY